MLSIYLVSCILNCLDPYKIAFDQQVFISKFLKVSWLPYMPVVGELPLKACSCALCHSFSFRLARLPLHILHSRYAT